MKVPEKLGVAVIGLGVGEQHARAYLAAEGCEVRCADLDPSKAEEAPSWAGRGPGVMPTFWKIRLIVSISSLTKRI
jgi:hypothetical protein